MPSASPHQRSPNQALYQALLDEAAVGGGAVIRKLVGGTLAVLGTLENASVDLRKRDALAASAKRLKDEEAALYAQFPSELRTAFGAALQVGKPIAAVAEPLEMGQLELMDQGQVEERVVLARVQQSVVLASEAQLAELDTLVCSAMGLHVVRPERNPLRPVTYVDALNGTLESCRIAAPMRLEWLAVMGGILGPELRVLYTGFSKRLRDLGVAPADYGVVSGANRAFDGAAHVPIKGSEPIVDRRHATSASSGYEGRKPARRVDADETLLTLEKLHGLLSGGQERPGAGAQAAFSGQFAQTFERGVAVGAKAPVDFDATVPAALVALKDMQQVDRVVHNWTQGSIVHQASSSAVAGHDGPLVATDASVGLGSNKEVVRALSLEVVKLMVENMARDRRLLPPIQHLIRRLEPALAQLSLVDPRLFTDKQHPARRLVEAIAHHSLAYASVGTTGFADFLAQVERAVAPLWVGVIDSGEPFAIALNGLQRSWQQAEQANARDQEKAVKALEHAEQRNVLADKIARQISTHRDAAKVPAVVIAFLCGPWAQVVAQARISGGAGTGAADRYQALISALLWSAHPELTHKNSAKLTQLLPLLLSTLREGLDTIQYPVLKASAFFEALMGLHQQAFRANQKQPDVPMERRPAVVGEAADGVVPPALPDEANPWLVPEEAQASNLMDLTDMAEPAVAAIDRDTPLGAAADVSATGDQTCTMHALNELPLGTWVELRVNEQWVRTQLTWASPHGSLFLFTSVFGTTQSMTRRSGEKLVSAGNLRIISGTPMVDGALDAVAQQAMRNSVGLGGA
jgi:hypothetical protein